MPQTRSYGDAYGFLQPAVLSDCMMYSNITNSSSYLDEFPVSSVKEQLLELRRLLVRREFVIAAFFHDAGLVCGSKIGVPKSASKQDDANF